MEGNVTNLPEAKIFRFVHHTFGHLGVDKCLEEIRYVFQISDLGKLRRFIVSCDVCQRVKHPNRPFTIEEKYFPIRPGDICAVYMEAYPYLREMFGISLCALMCFQNLLNYLLCIRPLLKHV